MSIFNKYSAPVRFGRSFFFLMIVIFNIVYFSQTTSYAKEAEAISALSDKEEVHSKNIYHRHTGNSDGGGCYSLEKTGTKEVTGKCGGELLYNSAAGRSQCRECGMGYTGNQSAYTCRGTTTKTVSYVYFDLGCNKDEDTLLGSLTVNKSTEEWSRNLTLTGTYEIYGDMSVAEMPYIWNGDVATNNSTYEVADNGVYTLQLNADANANTSDAIVSVEVKNVDFTGPFIGAHIQEPSSVWTRDGVRVTITDVADLQPDGSEGCGLHEMPYSYDGGESWTAENSCIYFENGTHSILVRDALENLSSYNVTFNNLDCFGPTIEAVDYDHTPNIKETLVTVAAKDIQPDGSEGCGLHDKPYSFDGGKTWTAENVLYIDTNRTISIAVRDALGNETFEEEKIGNFDCIGPEISYKTNSAAWTQKDVIVTLSAKDMNADGSDGVGLAKKWYSLDKGMTWSDDSTIEFDKNQIVTVIARDKYNNCSSRRIQISQIDREAPWVFINMEQLGSGQNMKVKLTATAGDKQSGLHEMAYSWDEGNTYGTENTRMITENGIYRILVRDNALNWGYAQVEVDVFPIIEIPAFMRDEKDKENETEKAEKAEVSEERIITKYVVQQDERVEESKPEIVQKIKEESVWKNTPFLGLILLLIVGGFVFWTLLGLCTMRIYVEDMEGELKYIGRRWVRYEKEHFVVRIPMEIIEKCTTTHFLLCSSVLFTSLFKEKDIAFLFPEEICIIRKVKRNIEISLL